MTRFRFAAIVLVVFAALSVTGRAAEVEPGFLYVKLTPGKAESFKIKLRTDHPMEKVWVQPVDYSIDRQGKVSIADLENKKYSGRAWCKLKPSEITLRKGRELVYDVPMAVPSGTPGGEYYMGVQVYTPLNNPNKEGNVTVKYELNFIVLVIMDVKGGTARMGGEVIEPSLKVENAIPNVQATFHNKSTVSLIARTAVIIRDPAKKVYDKFFLIGAGSQQPDGQAFLFPDGLRDFAGQGNRKLPSGKYSAEIFSIYGAKGYRCVKSVDFEVTGSDAVATPPMEDVFVNPPNLVLEMPAGGVKFQVIELKNRGLNAVDVKLSTTQSGVTFFPQGAKLEPGKPVKIRVGLKLPPAEDPRRDIPIVVSMEGGTEKDQKNFAIAIYAPGTAPKPETEEEKKKKAIEKATPKQEEKKTEDHSDHDHPHPK
jgi:hypothetical protein